MNPKGVFVVALQFVQVGLGALSVIYLARILNAAEYGWFVYYSTVGALLPLLAGWGTEHILIMQGSRDTRLLPALFGNAIVVRTATTIFLLGLLAGYIALAEPENGWAILCIMTGTLLAVYPSPVFMALYRIKGIHVRPWLLGFVAPAGFIAYLLCLPEEEATLQRVATGYLLAQVAVVTVYIPDLIRLIRPKFDLGIVRRYARSGGVFSASQSFDYLSARIDLLLLQVIAGPQAVGLYAAAQKIVSLLQIIPSSFHVVELPEFHRLAAQPAALAERFARLRALMIEIGFWFAGWLMLAAADLIQLLFGEAYAGSAAALRVLAWFGVLLFVTYPYYMLAEAMNRIEARLIAKVAMTLLGAIAITLLVPWGGFTWAGCGVIVSQGGFVCILHGLTWRCAGGWREIGRDFRPVLWVGLASAGAGLLQSALPYWPGRALVVFAAYAAIYGVFAALTHTSVMLPTVREAGRALVVCFRAFQGGRS